MKLYDRWIRKGVNSGQQNGMAGRVLAFLGWPCEFGYHCSYKHYWACGHRRMGEIKFEPRDLWVGLYWDRKRDSLHFYVCPVPTLVIHLWSGEYYRGDY